jgi:hypothetical protein
MRPARCCGSRRAASNHRRCARSIRFSDTSCCRSCRCGCGGGGRREPGYRERIGERFGRYKEADRAPRGDVLWIHAVSLGETRAAIPLIDRLRRAYPDAPLLVTHMTATGRAAGQALFGDRVVQAWLPYDVPFAIRGFLAHWKPRLLLIMETELWPNTIALARDRGVPVFLVNARMSKRSASGYARIAALSRPMMASLAGVAAQSEADAARIAALGAPSPAVLGNLKFDIEIADTALALGREFRLRFGETRPVWLAALDARRRGGTDPGRDRRARIAARDTHGHRSAPPRNGSRKLRRSCESAAFRSCAAATTQSSLPTSTSSSVTRWGR